MLVHWINDLTGGPDGFLPHLLPVDPSLHWANPIGRSDTRPNPSQDPNYWSHQYIDSDGRYVGPVPIVTHVHGADTTEESDGYAEAWYLPSANEVGSIVEGLLGRGFVVAGAFSIRVWAHSSQYMLPCGLICPHLGHVISAIRA